MMRYTPPFPGTEREREHTVTVGNPNCSVSDEDAVLSSPKSHLHDPFFATISPSALAATPAKTSSVESGRRAGKWTRC